VVTRLGVAVIGDSTLDVTVRPSEPLRPGGDVAARILVSPGGQGANVAVRLARRGTAVRLVTSLADDAAGQLLRQALEREGVELTVLEGPVTGRVVALIDGDGERTMISDRLLLDAAAVVAGIETEWLHCSGYPLVDDRFGDALAARLGERPVTTRLSVGGGSLRPDAGSGAIFAGRVSRAHPDLLLLSRDEAIALLGMDQGSLASQATALAASQPHALVVVTGGAAGSAAAGLGLLLTAPATALDEPMLDATGAGDAYAAALIAELRERPWPPSAADLQRAMAEASELGARVSRVVGAQAWVAGEPEPLP
jgi:ribokinase